MKVKANAADHLKNPMTEAPSFDGSARDEATGKPEERREHPRCVVEGSSSLLLISQGLTFPCQILDLSLEGCRLRTGKRCAASAPARAEVTFKVNGVSLRFLGVVRWADGKDCLGVQFTGVTARRREHLAELIGEVEQASAARVAKQAAEQAAEEQARRAAASGAPAHAAARARADARPAQPAEGPDALPQSQPEPAKRDRRSHSRRTVDTSATIHLIKIGSRLGGQIVDLSLTGCRIRCQERFPVGIYTRVEAEFRLEGLPFRLGGVIQVVHDRFTVGIRFLDMSRRKREQVEQLIEEIDRGREEGTGIRD